MPKRHFPFFHHFPSPSNENGGLSSLIDLSSGSKALVQSIAGGRGHCSRLASLGLTNGVEVDVLQNYGHGPLILSVRGVRLAIGRHEAGKILVHKI